MKLFPFSTVASSFIVALLSAGCSSSGNKPVADANHPANPDAAVAAPADHHDHTSAAPHDHSAASTPAATQMYECPMHPKVRSTNPEDRCPDCGMKINKKVPQESPR